jgi:alkylhydroperoxidase family enzyme
LSEEEAGGPRLAPLEPGEWDDFLTRLVDATGGPEHALNIFTTLGRHPELFRRWVAFGGALLAGELPGRLRELVILRTAARTGADYEWAHHAPTAAGLGVSGEELAALRRPLADHPWAPDERVVLGAVDEMHDTWTLSEPTWQALHGLLDDAQAIELVMLVGQYHLVALALRSLRIELEKPAGPGKPGRGPASAAAGPG